MIIREPRPNKNYYVLPNSIPEDTTMSWEARVLLIFLLVKPDNWAVSVQHIVNNGNWGRDKVYRILNELIEHGHIDRIEHRDEDGSYRGVKYIVREKKTVSANDVHGDGVHADDPH